MRPTTTQHNKKLYSAQKEVGIEVWCFGWINRNTDIVFIWRILPSISSYNIHIILTLTFNLCFSALAVCVWRLRFSFIFILYKNIDYTELCALTFFLHVPWILWDISELYGNETRKQEHTNAILIKITIMMITVEVHIIDFITLASLLYSTTACLAIHSFRGRLKWEKKNTLHIHETIIIESLEEISFFEVNLHFLFIHTPKYVSSSDKIKQRDFIFYCCVVTNPFFI